METLNTLIIIPLREMLGQVTGFIPTLVSALFLLVVGIFVAKFVKDLVSKVLKEIRLDKIADWLGLSDILHKGGVKYKLSDLITSLVYLILVVVFIFITVQSFGLTMMTDLMHRIMAYVPKVFSGVIVLVLGLILAKVVSKIVHATAHATGLPSPKFLERVSRWAVILYTVTVSLEEFGYGALLEGKYFEMIFAGIIFAFALAFGLGGKDHAVKYLQRHSEKK